MLDEVAGRWPLPFEALQSAARDEHLDPGAGHLLRRYLRSLHQAQFADEVVEELFLRLGHSKVRRVTQWRGQPAL